MVRRMYRNILSFIFLFSLLLITLFLFDTDFLFYKIYQRRGGQDLVGEAKLQYGVIIDAGSSGSRLFIYTWPPHSGKVGDLLQMTPLLDNKGKAVVRKVTPGLSSLANRPETADTYIKTLLDHAIENVPKQQHKETPFYLMATAGMRMITQEAQTAILSSIRRFVKAHSEFLFSDSHAKVISGEEEGVFGWITTNYLLGRFSHNHTDGVPVVAVPQADSSRFRSDRGLKHHRKRTVGTVDMGGGSMQIAYELGQTDALLLDSGTGVVTFSLGCRDSDVEHSYKVFVTTFLGFGANSARARYERVLLQTHLKQAGANHSAVVVINGNATGTSAPSTTAAEPGLVIEDPCLHRGSQLSRRVRLVNDSQGGLRLSSLQLGAAPQRPVSFVGTGKYHLCEARLQALLDKRPCRPARSASGSGGGGGGICTMSGRLHPPIDLATTSFYGFSEFWYSTQDVLGLGGPYNYFRLHSRALDHCGRDWLSLATDFRQGGFPHADWDRLKHQCFKSAWLTSVLHTGLAFPNAFSNFVSVHDIKGAEVQWSLGALLYQTRYFPLRAIEQSEFASRNRDRQTGGRPRPWYMYILLILSAAVVMATVFWMHLCRRPPYNALCRRGDFLSMSSSSLNGPGLISVGGGDSTAVSTFSTHSRSASYFQF